MFKALLGAAALAVLVQPAFADGSDLVEFLSQELDDIRRGIEAREAAPESPGVFERGKDGFEADIDRLLDEGLDIVAPETFRTWARRLDRIDGATAEAETRQADLMLERTDARTSQGVGMVDRLLGREHAAGSAEDIDRKLAETATALDQLKADREAVVAGLVADMDRLHGITLTPNEARALLYSVNGALLVDATLVMRALEGIERKLAEVMGQQIGPDARRTYAGIASVTRLLQARMLERHLAAYDKDWLPELQAMRTETEALLAQTRENASTASQEGVRATYAANMMVQEQILHVIDRYEAMLERQRDATRDALGLAEERAGAAVNTLLTLETAANLATVISDATAGYEALMEIDLPELETLDLEEFEQMLDISRRLGS
ncbi:hypothetical protein [Rhodovulum euryhalinum]|uniref:PilJ/NarX-like methyl-accepting chemotaxis transducer n=1 Tax=Rhodovulum euryhalinum TaxID=35805 RepID=A0A4R2KLR1_9RHOB|nr:hypothetical protein [Rhodovulum euryhalinum]TCO71636.1 hypothetical protein EV655_106128 [Rhodovulum euryhalinum]